MLKIGKEDKDGGEAEEAGQSQEEVEKPTKGEVSDDVRAKKKSDDLWASFLSDVGPRPKDIAHASELSTTQKVSIFPTVIYNAHGSSHMDLGPPVSTPPVTDWVVLIFRLILQK